MLPTLRRGQSSSAQPSLAMQISRPLFMVMGDNDGKLENQLRQVRRRLAFYASTKAYASVLDAVGLSDLQSELARLAKMQEWELTADLVDDNVLEHFAVVGRPEEMPALARAHLSGFITRTS